MPTTRPLPAHRRFLARWRVRLGHFQSPGDLRTLLTLGIRLALVPAALALLGLPRLLARDAAAGQPVPAVSLAQAQRLARYADVWLRRLRPRDPCLRRALVLFHRLRREGLPVTFCLGIRREGIGADDGQVTGHAWLELDGRVILESAATIAGQVCTFRYPSPAIGQAVEQSRDFLSRSVCNDLTNPYRVVAPFL